MADETENERKEPAKELLLADHKYFSELFLHSEQLGETRVNWYIGIVTAAIGGLVALITKSGLPWNDTRPLVRGAILALLVFGGVTLFRILQRNRTSDGFKKDLDRVRQIFREHFDPEYVLVDYQPLRNPSKRRGGPKKNRFQEFFGELWKVRKFGGLAYTVAAINSVLVGALAYTWFFGRSEHPLRIAAGAVVLSGLAHAILITVHELLGKRRLKSDGITHGGGVVFKTNGSSVEYLLVRPKENKFEWVLPKGHIRVDETSDAAAVREVKEETGVIAKVLSRLGTVSFPFKDKDIRTEFYLLEFKDQGATTEKRGVKWASYEEAMRQLTHSQSRAMVKRAREAFNSKQ